MRVTGWLAAGLATITLIAPVLAQDDPKAHFAARYAALRAAIEARDAAAASQIVTPDYAMIDIRGDSHDIPGVIAMSQRMQAKGGERKSELLSAVITGAAANVEMKVDTTSTRTGPDGQEHAMEMIAVSDDSWVLQDGIWRLKSSVQKDLTVKMDGEIRFHQAN